MSWSLRRIIGVVAALSVLAPLIHAQERIEERPEVLQPKPPTREERDRQKAEELFREAKIIYGLGVMRHRADRWLEAVRLLEQAAKLDPEHAAANRALIPLYMSLAREDDALVACRKVLERDPGDSDTAFQLAKLLKADGKPREAVAALTQGVNSSRAEDHPVRLYFMLLELSELQEKAGDFTPAAITYQRLARHLVDERARLVGSDTLSREQLAVAAARAYERIGHCCLAEKRYPDAVKAFEQARDFLDKQPDAETRLKAARLNWNLAQVFLTQEEWGNALNRLDAYLEHHPADPEPYEKKVAVLRKLGREREIVPALKRYAQRVPDVLGVQLLLARELAGDPRSRKEAEALYLALAERFTSPEIYRGLFKLYQANDQMIEVLNFVDSVFATVDSQEDIPAIERERARDRGRAMLQVLKSEPGLVSSLLSVVHQELQGKKERKLQTWHFLAGMAARAKKLDRAEILFRQCLARAPVHMEAAVYSGLLDVLLMQKKYDAIIVLCRDALYGNRKAEATNFVLFHSRLAAAYAEKEKFDDAVAESDKAIKLSAETGKVLQRCRKAHILAAAERYDAAVAECETLLKQLTDAAEIKQVRHTLATVYTYKGDSEKSDAQLLKILEDDPNDPGANNDLGYHWADSNRHLDEAEKMIRKAIEIDRMQRREFPDEDQDNAAYLDSLGWVLFRKGKLEEAREWLEKAVAFYLGNDDPTVWDHLGDVYAKLKQTKKAREAYQLAIKLYDDHRYGKKEGRQEEAKRKLKMVQE